MYDISYIHLYVIIVFTFLPFSSDPIVFYGDYASTSNAFIFSLHNKEGLAPFKSMVNNPSQAIYIYSSSGPTFGGGADIHIANNANNNTVSHSHFGHSYSVPSGVKERKKILAGATHFKPDEVEVFYLG